MCHCLSADTPARNNVDEDDEEEAKPGRFHTAQNTALDKESIDWIYTHETGKQRKATRATADATRSN